MHTAQSGQFTFMKLTDDLGRAFIFFFLGRSALRTALRSRISIMWALRQAAVHRLSITDEIPSLGFTSRRAASASCRSCGADFGLTTRRHHCRYCGRLFCVKCANQQAHAELLPPLQRRSEFSTAYRAQKVVRLCVGCADGLRGLCAALAKGEACLL